MTRTKWDGRKRSSEVSAHGIPAGGSTDQVLTKDSGTDYDVSWQTPDPGIPTGGTTGQVLTKNSGTNYDASWATPSGGGGLANFCGDGADGNVTPISSITLSQDMYYDTLTVNSGITINTVGFRIYCKTACIVNSGGKIHGDGPSASGYPAAVDTIAGSISQTVGNGTDGGVNGTASFGSGSRSASYGGVGGKGGTGTGTGGSGTPGTVTGLPSLNGGRLPRNLAWSSTGIVPGGAAVNIAINGGTGGTGGGGDSAVAGNGGGGGAAGRTIIINAPTVTNNGTISANGGNGARPPVLSGNKGGGGGGGGGVVIINCKTFTGNTPVANGGTGALGIGTGGTGANGSPGTVAVFTWT